MGVRVELLVCEAAVTDDKGVECASARATLVPLGEAQAVDAVGGELTDADAAYLRRT